MEAPAIVEKWLASKGWCFQKSHQQSRTKFEVEVAKEHGTYRLELYMDTRREFFAAYAYLPSKIPPKHHADILEIIARANWGYDFARFELNVDSSEFRCSSSAVIPGSELSTEMVERMAMFVIDWLDSFTPTLREMSCEELCIEGSLDFVV